MLSRRVAEEEEEEEKEEEWSTPLERYQKLDLRESLPKPYRYSIACKELSFILREAYHQCPKNVQSLVFQDILTAFRLLPEMQSPSAVSAVHFLLQSVEAALPKQKRNAAVTEFKHAMVAHKRRSKPHPTENDPLELPYDILVRIFCLIDMQSLVSVGLVCRSWNLAANDNYLWELQYADLCGSGVNQQPMGLVQDRNSRLLQEPIHTGTIADWKKAVKGAYAGALSKKLRTKRGYCGNCEAVVWLNNSKCPNIHCGGTSRIHDIKPVTASQVVKYLLHDSVSMASSAGTDSDSEEEPVSRLWAYPKHIKQR